MSYVSKVKSGQVGLCWVGSGHVVSYYGSPFDFTNWNPGESNNVQGEKQCEELEMFDVKGIRSDQIRTCQIRSDGSPLD